MPQGRSSLPHWTRLKKLAQVLSRYADRTDQTKLWIKVRFGDSNPSALRAASSRSAICMSGLRRRSHSEFQGQRLRRLRLSCRRCRSTLAHRRVLDQASTQSW